MRPWKRPPRSLRVSLASSAGRGSRKQAATPARPPARAVGLWGYGAMRLWAPTHPGAGSRPHPPAELWSGRLACTPDRRMKNEERKSPAHPLADPRCKIPHHPDGGREQHAVGSGCGRGRVRQPFPLIRAGSAAKRPPAGDGVSPRPPAASHLGEHDGKKHALKSECRSERIAVVAPPSRLQSGRSSTAIMQAGGLRCNRRRAYHGAAVPCQYVNSSRRIRA